MLTMSQVFLTQRCKEISATLEILSDSGGASGLVINLHECVFYLIACDLSSLVSLLDGIPCEVKAFPCKYLGLASKC